MNTPSRLPPISRRMIGLTLLVISVIGLFLAMKSGSDGLRLLLALHGMAVMASAIVVLQSGQPVRERVPARRR